MNGKQLKNSILQWAIQGKLVPQDPTDEPASELLRKIREEKARLVKEGKIKKDKNESIIYRGDDNSHYEKLANGEVRCIDSELPFEIPSSWEWVRLGELFSHCSGKALNGSNKSGTEHKYITTSNLYWDRFELDNLRSMRFTDNEIEKCTAKKGDLLVCEGGDIGRAAIWNYDFDIKIQNHIHKLRPYYPINTRYIYYIFFLYKHIGYIGGKGIAIQGLSSGALHKIILPIAPLPEQGRIVKSIEGLLPTLNAYEKTQNELDSLNADIFELLKKSILQEAIQGKLVEQCATDEPASMLLERIRENKKQLVKAGKLKAKDIVDSVIIKGDDNKYYEKIGGKCVEISDKIPFDIPQSWIWCRLKQICALTMGQSPEGDSVNGNNGIEFHQGKIQFGDMYLNTSDSYTNKPTKIAEAGSLLLCVRAPVGVLNITKRQICIGRGLCAINPYCDGNVLLWFYFLSTYKDFFEKKATGSTFKAISNDIIAKTLVPLPPLEEQSRIVERIQELCDKL